MKKVVPYEHRGRLYAALHVRTRADVATVARLYQEETDRWLKKILARKLLDARPLGSGIPALELEEASRCQIEWQE